MTKVKYTVVEYNLTEVTFNNELVYEDSQANEDTIKLEFDGDLYLTKKDLEDFIQRLTEFKKLFTDK